MIDLYTSPTPNGWKVSIAGWAGVETEDLPNLTRWSKSLAKRPAVARGRAVPDPVDLANTDPETIRESAAKVLA